MLEVKWKDYRLVLKKLFDGCFNPCYVGSKMESQVIMWSGICQRAVSILVMLEVKWKVYFARRVPQLYQCFNPCYVGSKMESGMWRKGRNKYL